MIFWPMVIPEQAELGPLKDMAQEVISSSASLEGRVAPATAKALGGNLRLLNSYYSNLIEGHKSSLLAIEQALEKRYDRNSEKRYAQDLCAAHILAEEDLTALLDSRKGENVAGVDFLKLIHSTFYRHLAPEHLFTHEENGFTDIPVMPGELRDRPIAVGPNAAMGAAIGPEPGEDLRRGMDKFAEDYDQRRFHGDERLIAMASAHHRLTWLHPFRDGNGRVTRLFSTLYMAGCNINRSNLWSLSRGLSRRKDEYMVNLFSCDPPPDGEVSLAERSDLLAGLVEFVFGVCLDQIHFMDRLLSLQTLDERIEWFVDANSTKRGGELHPDSSRLLRAVFMRGEIPRGEAGTIMNKATSTARRVVRNLVDAGLLTSTTPKSALRVALPTKALPFYFPDLYDPSVVGEEYYKMIMRK
ncbi:Fic family protein [Desulfovibrio sp. Fe33]|uniref:Fic family protein n=1 Tax=Desulfovibrio sp. Fe33 TaxID=3020842 RepID=UPI00234D3B9A|nr:Fic family protein [Desulfovibrio sp. Fe33]